MNLRPHRTSRKKTNNKSPKGTKPQCLSEKFRERPNKQANSPDQPPRRGQERRRRPYLSVITTHTGSSTPATHQQEPTKPAGWHPITHNQPPRLHCRKLSEASRRWTRTLRLRWALVPTSKWVLFDKTSPRWETKERETGHLEEG